MKKLIILLFSFMSLAYGYNPHDKTKILFAVSPGSKDGIEITEMKLYKYTEEALYTDSVKMAVFQNSKDYNEYLKNKITWIMNSMPKQLKSMGYIELLARDAKLGRSKDFKYFQIKKRDIDNEFKQQRYKQLRKILGLSDSQSVPQNEEEIGKRLIAAGYPHKENARAYLVYVEWKTAFENHLYRKLMATHAHFYETHQAVGTREIYVRPTEIFDFNKAAVAQAKDYHNLTNHKKAGFFDQSRELRVLIDLNKSKSLINTPFSRFSESIKKQTLKAFQERLVKSEIDEIFAYIDVARTLKAKYKSIEELDQQIFLNKINYQLLPTNLSAYFLTKILAIAKYDLKKPEAQFKTLQARLQVVFEELKSLTIDSSLIKSHPELTFNELVRQFLKISFDDELVSDDKLLSSYTDLIVADLVLIAKKQNLESSLGLEIALYPVNTYETQNLIKHAIIQPQINQKIAKFRERLEQNHQYNVIWRPRPMGAKFGLEGIREVIPN